jgi:hypothetical protein
MLPFIPSAVASSPVSDGATATVQLTGLDKYRGATELSATELADLLKLVGFEGKSLRLAWAVVMRESRGHPLSHNTNASTGDNSYGLFQINMIGDLGAVRREKFGIKTNAELLDPVVNAQAAFYMTAHGTDFGSWGLGSNAYDGSAAEPSVTKWLDDFPTK